MSKKEKNKTMKEYKVEICDIIDNVADVTVNGEAFKVEM